MKQRIKDFFIKNKYAVTWTALYIIMMWAVLYGLFHFNMLSPAQWHHLMRAHLYGFPGFVFGILVLAAVPMYVATTMIIVRTGKPIFTLPKFQILDRIEKFITAPKPVVKSDSDKSDEPAAPVDTDTETSDAAPAPLPANLPGELRAAFLNARQKPAPTVTAAKSNTPSDTPATPVTTPVSPAEPTVSAPTDMQMEPDGLPLPTDFDFASSVPESGPSFAPSFSPVFSDVSFGNDSPATSAAPTSGPTNAGASSELDDVVKHLNDAGRNASISDNVIICDGMAIGVHTDPDFWIADDPDWFATGKQKPSPVAAVLDVASAQNVKPVLYLGSQNIMDIDSHIDQWKSQDIRIITDLGDL